MPVNCSATANWLRKESLHTTGTVHCKLVLIGQFVHTEDCDNVLKFLVTLKYLLHTLCTLIMLLAYDKRVEDTRCGTQRIDSRMIPSSVILRESSVVASRWVNVVAGAGSVKSSAGINGLNGCDRTSLR